MDWEYSFKICFVGDTNVGKTLLLHKLLNKVDKYLEGTTIGVDCHYSYNKLIYENNYYQTKTLFWDTAGQERYHSIAKSYYKNVTMVCIVFNLTNRDKYKNIDKWIKLIKKTTDSRAKIVLIGNKADLKQHIFIKKYNYKYFEVSAKLGLNNLLENLLKLNLQFIIKNKYYNVHELGTKMKNNNMTTFVPLEQEMYKTNNKCCNIL